MSQSESSVVVIGLYVVSVTARVVADPSASSSSPRLDWNQIRYGNHVTCHKNMIIPLKTLIMLRCAVEIIRKNFCTRHMNASFIKIDKTNLFALSLDFRSELVWFVHKFTFQFILNNSFNCIWLIIFDLLFESSDLESPRVQRVQQVRFQKESATATGAGTHYRP